MDQIKIGKFIAALRKEKGLTQEQLGEKLGVTNKTVSRWENGNYMPDVEMLSLLSEKFGVSINELISGERLRAEDFKKAADSNLVAALNNSTFTLKEKIAFFKKKWLHEHIAAIVLCAAAWAAVIIWLVLKLRDSGAYALLGAVGGMLAVLFYVVLYNRMMAYVENRAYPATPDKETETKTPDIATCLNSILLVTTAQYCAYFTFGRYGAMIQPTKEKRAFRQFKTISEVCIMNKVVAFLNANPIQYLATVGRDGKAKCRPFMFAGELDGKLWFCTNNQKEVYKDMQANPYVELSVSSPEFAWIRLHGKAVFENNMAAKEMCIQNPIVKGQYGEATNPIFEVFYLADAHGVIADFSGNPPYEF